jgi:hypothetical protein
MIDSVIDGLDQHNDDGSIVGSSVSRRGGINIAGANNNSAHMLHNNRSPIKPAIVK